MEPSAKNQKHMEGEQDTLQRKSAMRNGVNVRSGALFGTRYVDSITITLHVAYVHQIVQKR